MWLLSVPTAVLLSAAIVGAALVRGLTDLTPWAALVVGAIAGWLVAAVALVPAAERVDRALHRMGGPRRRRR